VQCSERKLARAHLTGETTACSVNRVLERVVFLEQGIDLLLEVAGVRRGASGVRSGCRLRRIARCCESDDHTAARPADQHCGCEPCLRCCHISSVDSIAKHTVKT